MDKNILEPWLDFLPRQTRIVIKGGNGTLKRRAICSCNMQGMSKNSGRCNAGELSQTP
ncbi:MAG: hypothetical protein JSR78_07530 [Proteobacteria bacterium]|nr:hypothetical protein [Pseudomonadota bacterium]